MERPKCKCGNLAKKGKISKKTGEQRYHPYCSPCSRAMHGVSSKGNRLKKKGFCEICGFIPVHSCQLDLDHIDGNRKNNNKNNLQTLCANCHRLKSRMNKDWMSN